MIVGRRACPWCGFEGAHVKRGSDDKLPYHHCPECGCMTQARNGYQAKLLLEGMRTTPLVERVDAGAPAAPPAPPPTDNPIVVRSVTPPPAPVPPPRKPAGLWDALMGPRA